MFLMKCYRMLRNARNTAVTVSEFLRKNQQGVKLPPVHPEIPKIHKKAPMSLLYRRVYGDFEPYTSVTPSQTCGEVIWKTENDMGVQLFKLVIIFYA